jgi:predicted peptidase
MKNRQVGRRGLLGRGLAVMGLAGVLFALTGCERALLTPELARQLFPERSVTVAGRAYQYRVYLPLDYRKDRKWPVVLVLHGSNECGMDNLAQIESGLAAVIASNRERFPVLAVFPQCRPGHDWFGPMEDQAEAALDATVAEFHGDPERLIVTGLSLGGTGAWYFARHSGRFAASVPIAGEVVPKTTEPFRGPFSPDLDPLMTSPNRFAALAQLIGKTPVWAFAGTMDDVIDVTQSRTMVAALRAAGGDVRYTEYPDLKHDAWDRAYRDPDLTDWMLAQRLSGARRGNEKAPGAVVR